MGGKNGIEMEWIRAKALSGNVYWKGRKRCSLEGRGDKMLYTLKISISLDCRFKAARKG
jgi:hypothetical protein